LRIRYGSLNPIFVFCIFCLLSKLNAQQKTDSLKYPFTYQTGGLYLENPIKITTTYNLQTGLYKIEQKVASQNIVDPIYMTEKEYAEYILKQRLARYYKRKSRDYDAAYRSQKAGISIDKNSIIPGLNIKSKIFGKIFGGNKISIVPQGYASLDLGPHYQRIDNPQILEQNRSQFDIDLQQRIQLSLLGKIGENLQLKGNYDTQAGFAFENRLNLAFRPQLEGSEDNIIQALEVGNINMPLRSSLLVGPQALFGVKGEFKFGKTYITSVFSEQQSQSKTITTQKGGVVQDFEIKATDYEVNANFYLGDFFFKRYDEALRSYPNINSSATITRIEVWVRNRNSSNLNNKRSIIAIRDLGDDLSGGTQVPDNDNNPIYKNLVGAAGIRDYYSAASAAEGVLPQGNGQSYVVEENMRLLNPSEYSYNAALGTLFLNQPVNEDDVIAVSYQIQQAGKYRQVGEFSNEVNKANQQQGTSDSSNNTSTIITKLIKGIGNNPGNKRLWNLMMKNVYSLGTSAISPDNFKLDIYYNDQQLGLINYLKNNNATTDRSNQRLLSIENLDRLVQNGNVQNGGDGFFDFVSGITVDVKSGKVIFTTTEPFNKTVQNHRSPSTNQPVAYPEIYTEIQNNLTGESSANDKFFIKGQYTSSSSDDISLGAINVPEGSVKVTANGQELIEGVDYIVDYTLGTVKIINQAIKDSGVPVNINIEDQGLFNLTKQRFIGINIEQRFNENFRLGATVLNYSERSVTPKVNYGAEPVNNTMFGFNGFYSHEVPALTRWIDRLPLIETKAPSHITIQGEVAYLKPGQAKNTGNFSYLDDFEEAQSNISIKEPSNWSLAATPGGAGQKEFNGNAAGLSYNDNRVLASWYSIDPVFFSSRQAGGLSSEELSNNKSRRVAYKEIYPQQDFTEGSQSYISTFDFSYYPSLKGPYTVNPLGAVKDRWAGITRGLNVTNFNEANVEYVEFWLMDPYADGTNAGDTGDLILQVGAVSEDILKDGRKMYENGLPVQTPDTDNPTTPVIWGRVPSNQALTYTFDTENAQQRTLQDVGYDGLSDAQENSIYPNNNNPITGNDPAGDDYVYYLDSRWANLPGTNSIVERYKYYRNSEGNSPYSSQESTTPNPDVEDANRDFNLDTQENYFQYRIPISEDDIENSTYVVGQRSVNVTMEDGKMTTTKWYQMRVPINAPTQTIGSPSFNNIRFVRLLAKGFQKQITFRFATFDLVRSNWRRFRKNISGDLEGTTDVNINNFSVGKISIEENPDRYVIPPGIDREQLFNTSSIQAQNEQSLLMQIGGLSAGKDDNARAIYKPVNLDLRRYRRLEMFVHAQDYLNASLPGNGDLEVFIRLGTDLTQNYYEYAKPVIIGPEASAGMDPNEVWPVENKIDFNLHDFVKAKIARDASSNPDLNKRYLYNPSEDNQESDKEEISVKGRPSLQNVRYIAIGVRNKATGAKNVEVWVNELRLSAIDNKGGYAATASINAQLADFANLTAAGTIRTAGFGAIDQGPSDRSQEDYKQYNISTTINADKLLPKKWGVRLPVGLSVSKEFIDPLYSPLDTDVKFKEAANKSELKKIARDYTSQTSINLLNIGKTKTNTQAKKHFYDVENLSASFSFNKNYHRDFYIENHTSKAMRLGLNYNYAFKPAYLEPLKNWKAVHDTASSKKYLLWLKNLNVNLKPSRLSFMIDIDRQNDEFLYRNIDRYNSFAAGTTSLPFDPVYSNNYFFNWQYQIGYDLTKSLKLDFISSTSNIVDRFNDPTIFGGTNVGIWDHLLDTGRPVKYNQQVRLNYKIPFEQFPYLEFITGDVTYNAAYDWRAPSNQYEDDDHNDLGNIIQNSQTITLQGGLNMESLYGKMKWYNAYQERLEKYHTEIAKNANQYQKEAEQAKRTKQRKRNQSAKKKKNRLTFKDYLYGFASSLKQIQINYNKQLGTLLPGFLEEPGFFGFGSGFSPSFGFTLGSQADIRARALTRRWITQSDNLVNPYQKQKSNTFGYTANFVPINDLNIDFTAQRDYSNISLQYGFNQRQNTAGEVKFTGLNNFIQETGQFSTTNIGLTSFKNSQALFNDLKNHADRIGARLSASTGRDISGYGITNQEVITEALLKTYASSGHSNPVKNIPLPNWSISYTGLTNNKFLNKTFSQINLTHAYRSNYTVSGIQSNLSYYEYEKGINSEEKDLNGSYKTATIYNAITFVETFAPLIGIDMTLRNNLQLRFMYNRDRTQSFSYNNYSLTDQTSNEFQLGLGYIFKDLKLKLRYRGRQKTVKSDLNVRADLIIRDTESAILRLIEDDSQLISGDKQFVLKTTAGYNFSKNFNLTFFYNHSVTTYKISTAYPITDIRAGLTARFTFGN